MSYLAWSSMSPNWLEEGYVGLVDGRISPVLISLACGP
jgi:hypothetical protein